MKFVIIFIVFFLLIVLWYLSNLITKMILYPNALTKEQLLYKERKSNRFPEQFYDQAEKTSVIVKSPYGYELHCTCLDDEITKKKENQNKVCVLCHGRRQGGLGMAVYAKIVMKAGYTAILYDQRNHGETKKCNTSMGYYEKEDLKAIVDYCFEKYGKNAQVMTYGESMGAATVLMHLNEDDRIFLTIADCPYSDLNLLISYLVKRRIHISAPLSKLAARIKIKHRAGFNTKKVQPLLGAINSRTPILFIHGDQDTYVPTAMSVAMYEKRTGPKELYLCKGAEHAVSCVTAPKEYEEKVLSFIKEYENKSGK